MMMFSCSRKLKYEEVCYFLKIITSQGGIIAQRLIAFSREKFCNDAECRNLIKRGTRNRGFLNHSGERNICTSVVCCIA